MKKPHLLQRPVSKSVRKIIKKLAAIELGVIIIVALGSLSAWGTFVEARYDDSVAAQKLVYNSVWMGATMVALIVCLIAVMIDRLPWKQKHLGFILAHIGIITIIGGSLVTRHFGLDGSMSIGIGDRSRFVATDRMVLGAYASLGDNSGFRKVGEQDVDFFLNRPTKEHPFELPLAGGSVKVIDYYPYSFREEKVVESTRPSAGAAIRFQLQNPNVSLTEWLVQPGPDREVSKNLGPAQVIFTSGKTPMSVEGRNAIVMRPLKSAKDGDEIEYEVHTARDPKKIKRGKAKPGDTVETGWMGLVLRILKYMPLAEEEIGFKQVEQNSPMTTAAIKIDYNGREQWLGANSMIRLFTDQAVYVVTYGHSREDLQFDLALKDFHVGRYQGTLRAASYESVVDVPGVGEHVISMNEPLKYRGFTFYQASFQEDEQGRPIVSVLSVNKDPGRWIKYLGSLLIVLGTIHLFYFKRRSTPAARKSNDKAVEKSEQGA